LNATDLAVLGVDLAGVPGRPTGICLLQDGVGRTQLLYTDKEILEYARESRPALVAIDAPLNLPPGRKSMADRNGLHYRPCDLELRRRGIPFFPITLGPMRKLTLRGIRLKRRLEAAGFRVVEIYPGGAQDVWGIPRAKRGREGLRRGLSRLGVKGLTRTASDHELDAASGALTGWLFLMGGAEVLGDFASGAIIMPDTSVNREKDGRHAASPRPPAKKSRA
jgi:predicted nuclease with RNAse H fold